MLCCKHCYAMLDCRDIQSKHEIFRYRQTQVCFKYSWRLQELKASFLALFIQPSACGRHKKSQAISSRMNQFLFESLTKLEKLRKLLGSHGRFRASTQRKDTYSKVITPGVRYWFGYRKKYLENERGLPPSTYLKLSKDSLVEIFLQVLLDISLEDNGNLGNLYECLENSSLGTSLRSLFDTMDTLPYTKSTEE